MKHDKRFIKTEKLLLNSFFELLKTESYNDITIEKLCENALIGKNTFYAHYRNKDDFLLSLIGEYSRDFGLFFEKNAPIPDVFDDKSVETFIECFFFALGNRAEEFSLLFKNDSQINFSERLLVYGRNFYLEHLEKISGSKVTDIKTVLLMDSLAAGIIRLQKGYFLHRNEVSREEIVNLAKSSFKDVVKQINSSVLCK